ncbi:MAG: hypothetical protein LBS96_07735 [Oscillospiraceae bacterium]|jgi:hypothetical protein|nr:hypothetical protein [Oscillospiraceae bacterium]
MAEPIQVDFSGKGKKNGPKKPIVIPPERAGLRILLSLAGTVITALVGFYVMLPPLNLKAQEFYYYIGLVLISFPVFLFLLTGTTRRPEYVPYVRKTAKIPLLLLGIVVVFFALAWAFSSPFFQAKKYSEIMPVDAVKFADTMDEASFTAIPKLDEDTALAAASRALGDMANETGRVSQFVLAPTNTQINYKLAGVDSEQKPYRVATLAYSNVIKWFTNTREGLPGYILVNMDNRTTRYVESPINYSDQEHFNKLLKRHVRFQYPTKMFGTANFEVDDTGKPWWIVPIMDKKAGLLGGEDVIGIITVDAKSGQCTDYTMDAIKSSKELQWIDRIYSATLLTTQYNYHGKYVKGFWNSILGQDGVTVTSIGYNYIAQGDDVWMYTGITSITSDDSIIGFVMVNQRTKETLYYENISGATEESAKTAAETLVSDLGWKASFPLLINVGGQPTYFVSLKNPENTVVNGFAMVHVGQYGTVKVKADNLQDCIRNYVLAMKKAGLKVDESAIHIPNESDLPPVADPNPDDPGQSETPNVPTPVTGEIEKILTQNIDGTTVYYIKLKGDAVYYSISAAAQADVIFYNVGNTVEITFTPGLEGAKTVEADKIADTTAVSIPPIID